MNAHERRYETLKEKVSEIIPIIESSIKFSGCRENVIIDKVEIPHSSAEKMLKEFTKISDSVKEVEISYGIIPMKLLLSNQKMKEIQVVMNEIRKSQREEELEI